MIESGLTTSWRSFSLTMSLCQPSFSLSAPTSVLSLASSSLSSLPRSSASLSESVSESRRWAFNDWTLYCSERSARVWASWESREAMRAECTAVLFAEEPARTCKRGPRARGRERANALGVFALPGSPACSARPGSMYERVVALLERECLLGEARVVCDDGCEGVLAAVAVDEGEADLVLPRQCHARRTRFSQSPRESVSGRWLTLVSSSFHLLCSNKSRTRSPGMHRVAQKGTVPLRTAAKQLATPPCRCFTS